VLTMLPKKCYPLLVVSMGLGGTRPSVNKPFILVRFSEFFARYIPSHA